MAVQRFNTDDSNDRNKLISKGPFTSLPQALPRRFAYGSPHSKMLGLEPMEDFPSLLIQPADYRDRLEQAHQHKELPIYHMYHTWRPQGKRYNQNGLGYCWTWSGTGCLMTTRAVEDKDMVLLAPVSMGYLVGWANRGNYLESFITGARDRGICPAPDGDINSLNRSASFWQQYESERARYRLGQVWDCSPSRMVQHCVSGLCYGRSGYIAYNWWGHALELVGIRYNGNEMEWLISNSHNEDDVIILTGSRAIPDECYFFVWTKQDLNPKLNVHPADVAVSGAYYRNIAADVRKGMKARQMERELQLEA